MKHAAAYQGYRTVYMHTFHSTREAGSSLAQRFTSYPILQSVGTKIFAQPRSRGDGRTNKKSHQHNTNGSGRNGSRINVDNLIMIPRFPVFNVENNSTEIRKECSDDPNTDQLFHTHVANNKFRDVCSLCKFRFLSND
jgi:hypothetical protein